jgi:uncharacterized protein YqjF (DUF2071 family)
MAGPEPEERVPLPILHQSWRDVGFLHWRYDPATIAALLPRPFSPDVWEGAAWVTLTPFRVTGSHPPLLPPVPWVSDFPETNLRTYVTGPTGADGLWFFTLEVDSTLTTIGARIGAGVPYHWADMQVEREGDQVHYLSERRGWRPGPGHHIVVEVDAPLPPEAVTDLDHWLTGRWRSWTRVAGRPVTVPVRHQRWPLWRAAVVTLEETLVASVGLPPPDAPPLVHFSPGVDVRLGVPRLHR